MDDADLVRNHGEYLKELMAAAGLYDHERVRSLASKLGQRIADDAFAYPSQGAKQILTVLRRNCYFDEMVDLAEVLGRNGQRSFTVRRQHAQGLLDRGRLTQGIEVLLELEAELRARIGTPAVDPEAVSELPEAVGLLGRAYKQLYVNAFPNSHEPREADLNRAKEWYLKGYKLGPHERTWHGINYAALLTHAERVRLAGRDNQVRYAAESQRIARDILDVLQAKEADRVAEGKPLESWDLATMAEAHVALGRPRDAVPYVERYLAVADAFDIRSTLRQLRELWLLDEAKPPGSFLLPLLKAKLAQMGGNGDGETVFAPGDTRELEALFGGPGSREFLLVEWLRDGVDQAAGVARIGRTPETGHGTGFLMGGAIDARFADRPLLITNAHVICPAKDQHIYIGRTEPLVPAEACVTFHTHRRVDGRQPEFRAKGGECLWVDHELDCCILELDRAPAERPGTTRVAAAVPIKGEQVYVLGHAAGADLSLSFSIKDNRVVGHRDNWLSYRTSTAGGNSGSPVLNRKWELAALHRGSEGAPARANVGALMSAIVERARKALVV